MLRLAAALAFLAAPVAAQQVTYDCRHTSGGSNLGSWLAERVVVEYDGGETAKIYDPIARHFTGAPFMTADVVRDNNRIVIFSYEVPMSAGSGTQRQRTTMLYRLSVRKSDNQLRFTGNPQGYANTFSARGECAIR